MVGFLGPIIGGAIGGFASLIGANESSDAVSDAAAASNQLSQRQFEEMVRLTNPARTAGDQARDLMLAGFGIGPTSGSAQSYYGTPQNALAYGGDNPFAAYGAAYPDVANAWNTNSHNVQSLFNSPEQYYQWHYQNHGQGEGRALPGQGGAAAGAGGDGLPSGVYTGGGRDLTGIPGSGFPTNPSPPQGSLQDQQYANFLDSGFARSMLHTTENDMDTITGAMGAGGKAISGSHIKALNDVNQRNTNAAYGQYYNALAGLSGAGQVAASQQGTAGMQLAGMQGANNMNAANAQATAYGSMANTIGSFGNALAYGAGAGWWGGGSGGGYGGGTGNSHYNYGR